jgi:hypothetical protein
VLEQIQAALVVEPMNWGRGLFRVWLLLSICWILSLTWIQWDKIIGRSRDDLDRIESNVRRMIDQQHAREEEINLYLRGEGFSQNEFRERYNLVSARLYAASWIVVPPGVLLLLGFSLLWVGRGFRR